jgi:hypothetical protein
MNRSDFRISRRAVLAGTAGLAVAPVLAACATSPRRDPVSGPAYYDRSLLGARRDLTADVCVYGATAGGVAAAVAASRLGKRTVLLAFGDHIGGMTTSGVSVADIGSARTVGGIAAEAYLRIGRAYGHAGPVYDYEPHVATGVLTAMLRGAGVTVVTGQPVAGVTRRHGAIASLETEAGTTVRAAQYVDASYEGDLMARTGVAWTAGRESAVTYGESLAGYRPAPAGTGFPRPVDAYRAPALASSGLLDGVSSLPATAPGRADGAAMAYAFRLCITAATDRVPFPRPSGYRAEDWDLAARAAAGGQWELLDFRVGLPGGKYDLNAAGGVSTDAIGVNQGWAAASFEDRQRIFARHLAYTQGLLWFAGHDPRVPAGLRAEVTRYGLARDEWTATGGWPPELYVREARRLVGPLVATQADCTGARTVADPVAFASYKLDCHPCQRVAVDGVATNEGTISVGLDRPWGISLRSLLPDRADCTNLTVAVCVSASHVAWSSLRMEPVFMMLGQAAATVAALAVTHRSAVGDVPWTAVAASLRRAGAYLGDAVAAPTSRAAPPA